MSFSPSEIIFDKEKGTLLLSIPKTSVSIPEFVSSKASQNGFSLKNEFHITIFGFGAGQRILKKLDGESGSRENFLNEIQQLAESTNWSMELTNQFYHLKKTYKTKDGGEEFRESYIVMVKLSEVSSFVREVSDMIKMHLDAPPPHMTLYSKSSVEENMLAGIGVGSEEDLKKLKPVQLSGESDKPVSIKTIALPTRSQPDTIIAIFILKQFGGEKFLGIADALYEVMPRMKEGETNETLLKQGILPVDIGGGVFDHHSKPFQTTASNLVSEYLGVRDNPALTKLLQFAERDDFYGKGIISNDPLDRAFGLSGLIGSLNRKYVNEPGRVIDIVLPLIEAFYTEENKRSFEMPQEYEDKVKAGKAEIFEVRQRGRFLKCIFIETDNASMAGFLRSKGGGGFDVVALKLSSGHINILTKPITKPDLRSLVVLVRIQETEARGLALNGEPEKLSVTGTMKEVPEWYYDPATNSLLNGGPNPQEIKATSIDPFEFKKILELGLSEQLWSPR